MQQQETRSIFEDKISPGTEHALIAVARWSKLIAVIGFAVGAFVVIIMLFSGAAIFEKFIELSNISIQGIYGLMIAAFFIFFFIMAAILYFLYKGATLLQQGVQSKDNYLVAEGFNFFRKFFIASAIISALGIIRYIVSLTNVL